MFENKKFGDEKSIENICQMGMTVGSLTLLAVS